MTRRGCLLITLLLAVLVPAGLARASVYSDVLKTYQTRATIPACQYPSAVLSAALKGVDTSGAQYFADFTAAIQTALENQASGACASPRAVPVGGGLQRIHPQALVLGSVAASTGSDLPAPLVLLAVLAALALLLAAVTAVWHFCGWDPAPAAAWRHAWQEAGFRLGGTWAEFVDWLRSA